MPATRHAGRSAGRFGWACGCGTWPARRKSPDAASHQSGRIGGHAPPTAGQKLAPNELALLRRWIEEGANYSQHWAYVIPQRPAVPALPATFLLRGPTTPSITTSDNAWLKKVSSRNLKRSLCARSSCSWTLREFLPLGIKCNNLSTIRHRMPMSEWLIAFWPARPMANIGTIVARLGPLCRSAGYADDPARNIWPTVTMSLKPSIATSVRPIYH